MTTEPIPVIPLEYANPATAPRGRVWLIVARVALIVSLADLLVGWALIQLVDAETVIATAPVLCAAGLVLLFASLRLKLTAAAILGLAHAAICLFFTMLVNVRNWSPNEATLPFTVMGGVYTLGVALPVTIVVWLRMRSLAATMTRSTVARWRARGGTRT